VNVKRFFAAILIHPRDKRLQQQCAQQVRKGRAEVSASLLNYWIGTEPDASVTGHAPAIADASRLEFAELERI
jgi:hypothetical protein